MTGDLILLRITTPEGSTRYAEVTLDGFVDARGEKVRASAIAPLTAEEQEYVPALFQELRESRREQVTLPDR